MEALKILKLNPASAFAVASLFSLWNKMFFRNILILGFFVLSSINLVGQCPSVLAYEGAITDGNQEYVERLGLVFTNTTDIMIEALAAFDDMQDGLNNDITVGIIRNSDEVIVVGPVTLSGSGDPLQGSYRVQAIGPVLLTPGTYTIVAVGYGLGERNGNSSLGGLDVIINSGGILTFDGSRFGGVGFGYPTDPNISPDVFHAGSFIFSGSELPDAPTPDIIMEFACEGVTGDDRPRARVILPGAPTDFEAVWTIGANPAGIAPGTSFSPGDDIPGVLSISTTNRRTVRLEGTAPVGTYEFCSVIRDRSTGCESSETCGFSITLYEIQMATIMADPDGDICDNTQGVQYSVLIDSIDNETYTYMWCAYNSGDASTTCENYFDDDESATPIGDWNSGPGSKSIEVTLSSSIPGCATSYFYYFEVLPLPAITCPSDTSLCANETLDLTTLDYDEDPIGGSFIFSGDGVDGNIFDASEAMIGNNTITVVYTAPNGCTDTCMFDISVVDIPNNAFRTAGTSVTDPFMADLDYDDDHVACPGDTVHYGAEADPLDVSYSWSISGGGTILQGMNSRNVQIRWETSGVHTLTLEVTDNTTNCTNTNSLEVTVLSPLLICPEDIFIVLDALACDTLVAIPAPTNGSSCPITDPEVLYVDGLEMGNRLPQGVYFVRFELIDDYDNRDTCTFQIHIDEFQPDALLCKDVNMSLSEICLDEMLTPGSVLSGDMYGCLDSCTITIKDKHGAILPNIFNVGDVGNTYIYTIECGDLVCHAEVTVEDKLPPMIICVNDTISCTELNNDPIPPDFTDNCGATIELVNQVWETFQCDPELTGRLIRTWIATDLGGNKDTCVQEVGLRRTDLDGIVWPENMWEMGGNPLICGTGFELDEFGNPHPSVTGSPQLNGMDLYPLEMGIICNGFVRYKDSIDIDTECKKRIRRFWEVGEWWCTEINLREWIQFIDVLDTLPPVLSSLPQDRTVSTGAHECIATVVLPPIGFTDLCTNLIKVNIDYPFGYLANSNGGTIQLPEGEHLIIYEVIDKCNQAAYHEITITVMDLHVPTPICRQNLIVALNQFGTATLHANTLDNGSYDVCTDVSFLAKRLDPGCDSEDEWVEQLFFCCEDAGKNIMVALLVMDENENTNICMINVAVQDKIEPKMTCLPDSTVDCRQNYDFNSLTTDFGFPEAIDNCPENFEITERVEVDFNQCGIGEVTRIFDLVNSIGDTVQTCEQTIYFIVNDTLSYEDIIWPQDTTIVNLCENNDDLLPENLPEAYGFPVLPDTFCNLSAYNYWEEIFDATEGSEACFKIVRTWRVIDWCTQIETINGTEFLTFEKEQIIKISNTIAPIILSSCVDTIIGNNSVDCGKVELNLTIDADDDCTPVDELIYLYSIDMDDDGMIDVSGVGKVATDSFEVGIHRIFWEVLDRCGNSTMCDYAIEVVHAKPPTPIAFDTLSTTLIPMDFGGGPGDDTAMVTIYSELFDNKSFHPCGFELVFSFSSDTTDTERTYGCDDIGIQPIQFWVTDENGNQAFVNVHIRIIEDSLGICPVNSPRVGIYGRVYTDTYRSVENTEVHLFGAEIPSATTNVQGEYHFGLMEKGGQYRVEPEKNDDILNGVSTLDLVIIQRHILGAQTIDSPYRKLAADINNDGRISVADIMELRRVILGHRDHFLHNKNWKFVDASYDVEDPNLWLADLPTDYKIDQLEKDMEIDFIAVKVGDVSGDAAVNIRDKDNTYRSTREYILNIKDREIEFGEEVIMEFYGNTDILMGLQYALESSDLRFTGWDKGSIDADHQNFLILDNEARMSFSSHVPLSIGSGELVLFKIHAVAMADGKLSEMVRISDSWLKPEAYYKGNEENLAKLVLAWTVEEDLPFNVYQNFPNPWRDRTMIKFDVPQDGNIQFVIRDISGRELMNVTEFYPAGTHTREISKNSQLSGRVLIYEVTYGDTTVSKRMIKIE